MCGIVGCVRKNSEGEGKKQSQESERLEASHGFVWLLVHFVVKEDVFGSEECMSTAHLFIFGQQNMATRDQSIMSSEGIMNKFYAL